MIKLAANNVALVMELAVLLSAGLHDWIDFGVIIGILMLNACVGWYQEKQAADVVASLKGDIAMRSVVIRSGQERTILARELVPGDIVGFRIIGGWHLNFANFILQIIIEEGRTVPADAILICDYNTPEDFNKFKDIRAQEGVDAETKPTEKDDEENDGEDENNKYGYPVLATDQSAITGESLAVDKYMGDMLYYTTGCKRGKVCYYVYHLFLGHDC